MKDLPERNEWYLTDREDKGYFSSSVTLYRNFDKVSFMSRIDVRGAEKVLDLTEKAVADGGNYDFAEMNDFFNDKYPFYDKVRFTEEWKMTKEFVDTKLPHALVTDGRNLFVTVNDTEHLNIKALYAGNGLRKAYETCNKFAGMREFKNRFAYSGEFGYLTADPENVGTGLRAEIVLNIPSICLKGAFGEFDKIMEGRGIDVVKPFPGTEPRYTGLIKITNSQTLGADGESIINNLCEAAEDVIAVEKKAEADILRGKTGNVSDVVWRALGTLRYARSITFKEAVRCVSLVSFGAETGLIDEIDPFCMAGVIFSLRHAGLCAALGKAVETGGDNEARAEYLRKYFTK